MFGLRVLLVLLGIGLVIWILIRLARGSLPASKPQKRVDAMVQCAHCGIFVPKSEAIRDGEHFFCSRAHRDQEH